MTNAVVLNFPITLNPTAPEFRPTFPPPLNPNYYTFPLPPQPPPPPPPPYMFPPPPPSTVPTRALLLSSVPTHVSESTLRRELEVFGDVRAVQMERSRDGIVTVHFYDIRQATEALTEIKEQHMKQQCRLRKYYEDGLIYNNYNYNINYVTPVALASPARGIISGRAVWAQYTFPVAGGLPDGYNQGNVVVFNLGSDVSSAVIREIFEAFGCVKEIRDASLKKNQKIIEFYDTRDAAKAVAAVNGREICGKQVVVEFSRPGGYKYNYKQNKVLTIGSGGVQPAPYHPQPPCRKDRVVDYGGAREVINVNSYRDGYKKNRKNFFKSQQRPLEREAKWLSGSDCDGNGGRNKPWKGSKYGREKCDEWFSIKEDDVISSDRDPRTTVMIKNIPNKYSRKLLINMLDNHCIQCDKQVEDGEDGRPMSSYDFVYLPIDFVNKCNVGYGFVNMTSPEATWRLYKAFHNKNWEVFNSKKICEISYARLQGIEALKEHFKNSKFPREAEEYMPVVFTPPRDGRTLTEPTPITGSSSNLTSNTTITSSLSSSVSSSLEVLGLGCNDEEDDDVTDTSRSSDNLLVEEEEDIIITTKSDIRTTSSSLSTTSGGDRNEEV
ncbi:protein terminal ear1 homolog [Rutidosis leptorrhynchoides]|uniref:protein terminal ear1 homolog n=1 Tax=Rutidosis leptorrhynchoides TaxID=125765 RepID=UPI003A999B7B